MPLETFNLPPAILSSTKKWYDDLTKLSQAEHVTLEDRLKASFILGHLKVILAYESLDMLVCFTSELVEAKRLTARYAVKT